MNKPTCSLSIALFNALFIAFIDPSHAEGACPKQWKMVHLIQLGGVDIPWHILTLIWETTVIPVEKDPETVELSQHLTASLLPFTGLRKISKVVPLIEIWDATANKVIARTARKILSCIKLQGQCSPSWLTKFQALNCQGQAWCHIIADTKSMEPIGYQLLDTTMYISYKLECVWT